MSFYALLDLNVALTVLRGAHANFYVGVSCQNLNMFVTFILSPSNRGRGFTIISFNFCSYVVFACTPVEILGFFTSDSITWNLLTGAEGSHFFPRTFVTFNTFNVLFDVLWGVNKLTRVLYVLIIPIAYIVKMWVNANNYSIRYKTLLKSLRYYM